MATVKRHVKAIIQFRRATEPEWIKYNPILRSGEPALSTDVMKVKVGDGVTDWINLDYIDRASNDKIVFVETLDEVVGEEGRLYIKTTDGTAYIWKDDHFIEMESSSIEELKNRVAANEEEIAVHTQEIGSNSHQITANTEKIAELEAEIEEGADKNYIHKQQSASDMWTIVHNLGKFPSITVVDSAGTVVTGEIVLQTTEQAVISFNGAFSGKAYCN